MKNIAVITGTRADYGLLKSVCTLIDKAEDLSLKLIVTGSHLSQIHGYTYNEIKEDGFSNIELINLGIESDTPHEINKIISQATNKFSLFFKSNRPDIAIILGDRYELVGVGIALLFHRIPIAHIGGGEVTEGAVDDTIRHCLTKLSNIHFTSTEQYTKRVIQLGENPRNVFYVGGLGAQAVTNCNFLTKRELEKKLGFNFLKKNLLVTYHPETMSMNNTLDDLEELLKALSQLAETNIIFTMPNADEGFKNFFKAIENFVKLEKKTRKIFKSLGQVNYLSCIKVVDAVIGNSSSGILEAPSFPVGVINIGERQKGRIRTAQIIDIKPKKNQILQAIKHIYSKEYKALSSSAPNPYFKEKTAENIVEIIRSHDIYKYRKSFFDLDHLDNLNLK